MSEIKYGVIHIDYKNVNEERLYIPIFGEKPSLPTLRGFIMQYMFQNNLQKVRVNHINEIIVEYVYEDGSQYERAELNDIWPTPLELHKYSKFLETNRNVELEKEVAV